MRAFVCDNQSRMAEPIELTQTHPRVFDTGRAVGGVGKGGEEGAEERASLVPALSK